MDSSAELSAQGWFKLMVRTSLAPGLATLGFVGSGHVFRSKVDDYWTQVSLHQSEGGFLHRIRFTVDLGVVQRNEWDEQLRVRPYYPARHQPASNNAGWSARIGELVTVGGFPIGDLWWELDAGRPFESLADEIVSAVRTFGMPAMSEQISAVDRGL